MSTHTYRIAAGGAAWMLLLTGPVLGARGDLDPAFGTSGRVIFDNPQYLEEATSIVERDGKLLIGRNVVNFPIGEAFSVVRLNANGAVDNTFGGRDGTATVTLPFNTRGITYAVLPLANGKIIAAGYISGEGGLEVRHALVRYDSSGVVDPSFGIDGVMSGDISPNYRWIRTLLEQPDGRLIVAGGIVDGDAEADMWIGRLNADGSPDASFANGGIFRVDYFDADARDAVQALALQDDGSIVAAGYAVDASGMRHAAMLRLTPGGARDATFGSNGVVTISAPSLNSSAGVGMGEQDDGKLVIATQSRDDTLGTCDMHVARFSPAGQPDPSFSSDGLAQWSLGTCWTHGATSLLTEPGGIIVGYIDYWHDALLQRLTASGEFDASFGVDGVATVDTGAGAGSYASPDSGVPLARLADGKIALAASDQFDWWFGGTFFVVARLLESGGSPGLIGFKWGEAYVTESSGSVTLTVRRAGGALGAVSVNFTTSPDGGLAGRANFEAAQGTLTWADGDASERTIEIRLTNDSVWEGSEWLNVVLSSPTGGASMVTSKVFLYIEEDDPAPPPPPPPPVSGGLGSDPDRRGGALGAETLLALGAAFAIASRRRPKRSSTR